MVLKTGPYRRQTEDLSISPISVRRIRGFWGGLLHWPWPLLLDHTSWSAGRGGEHLGWRKEVFSVKSRSSLLRNRRGVDRFARHDSHILGLDLLSFHQNCAQRRVIFVDWGGIHSSDVIWAEVYSFCRKTSPTYTYKKREKWAIERLNEDIKRLRGLNLDPNTVIYSGADG